MAGTSPPHHSIPSFEPPNVVAERKTYSRLHAWNSLRRHEARKVVRPAGSREEDEDLLAAGRPRARPLRTHPDFEARILDFLVQSRARVERRTARLRMPSGLSSLSLRR